MARLSVSGITLRLGTNMVLRGIDAEVGDGEIVALLGRSGSGKSTLLRAVVGLETPDAGSIAIGDRVVFDRASGVDLPPERRGIGLVFQSYALWPHKTVRDNVAYGLKVRRHAPDAIADAVDEALRGVGLDQLADRYPGQLSGGQQQRVALARALAYRPPLILLDEPLSNLDAQLREEARLWIRQLIKASGLTALFVTHDQAEAMAIADRIMLLDAGTVVQADAPADLYRVPGSLFAATFMGTNSSFPATVLATEGGRARIAVGGREIWGVIRGNLGPGDTATAVIRLEAVTVAESAAADTIPVDDAVSLYLGDRWEHSFRAGDIRLRAVTPGKLPSGPVHLRLPPETLWLF